MIINKINLTLRPYQHAKSGSFFTYFIRLLHSYTTFIAGKSEISEFGIPKWQSHTLVDLHQI